MGRLSHTADELAQDLRRMGVRAGSALIVHSSMKSIGAVKGGPGAVIRALQAAVTPAGAVLMPAFSYSMEKTFGPSVPFSPQDSPSDTGLIPETFRRCAGVRRSLHPSHSVAAWGKRAEGWLDGHGERSAFDPGTPLHRAARDGATVLMIGCGFESLSLLHVAESVAEVPYLGVFCWWHEGWKPEALRIGADGAVERVRYPRVPGCSRTFPVLQPDAERRGLVRRARLGNAEVLVIRADGLLDFAVSRLRRKPDALLCPLGTCRACDERRTVFQGRSPAARRVRSFLLDTVAGTGIRLTGTPEERQAADLIAGRLRSLGLEEVRVLEFPVPAWMPGDSGLEVRVGEGRDAAWRVVRCAPVALAPATAKHGVEGDLVHLESMADMAKLGAGKGRIAVLWDGCGSSRREFRGLMRRGFRGFLYVDRRFCHGDHVAVGIPAGWAGHFSVPMVSVPFPEAARLLGYATRARLLLSASTRPGTSCNVVGEIPGTGKETIVVCAHHDSTFNSVAADDNLTGVAVLLEIARALAREGRRPLRTVRFCTFGAEEVLSEGARAYALDQRGARGVRFVLNNDSVGARVGTMDVSVAGPSELASWIRRRARRTPLQFRIHEEITPFSDHFPFNAAGSPSLWFYRQTLASGRHFHHTVLDTPAAVSFDRIAELAGFQTELVRELAFAARWPFPPRMPKALAGRIAEEAEKWIGLRRTPRG